MQPAYVVAPTPQVPAELQSLKSFLNITRLLALIFGILILLGGVGYVWAAYSAYALCTSFAGAYCVGLGAYLVGPIVVVLFGVFDLIIWMQIPSIERLVDAGQYEQAKSKTLIWMILGFIIGGVIIGILLLLAYLKYDPLINMQRSGGMQPGSPMMAQPAPAYGQPAPAYGQPQPAPAYGQAPPAYGAPPASPPQQQAYSPAPTPAPAYQAPPQQQAYGAPPAATAAPAAAAAPAAPAAATPGAPACRTCGKPTTWVPQYSRYYCYTCAQYA